MTYKEILKKATESLSSLNNRIVDVVDVASPPTVEYAEHLAKVVSKLSPLVGNMIEYSVCIELNKLDWKGLGEWKRQDPGFPDTIFDGPVTPTPGIEIKTWFPLATEMTARFKDSTSHFKEDQTYVAVVAWLPEYIIYGRPQIIDVWVGKASELAKSRDTHYHNPPDYLIFEPEDTTLRTANLQQTNTNGYKFQGDAKSLEKAEKEVETWGKNGKKYKSTKVYQNKIKELLGKYTYRLDTNYAKIDRIQNQELEDFKTSVMDKGFHGKSIKEWRKEIANPKTDTMELVKNLK